MPAPYPDKQRQARRALSKLFASPGSVRIVHYSCEDLDNRDSGQSPRVTSIAVRRLDTGQTTSFSIHAVAEERSVLLGEIDAQYNGLEREMLDRFYQYVGRTADASFLHWNMRDAGFGFAALEHRTRVLGGTPGSIPEAQRFDLGRMLQDMYGNEYIENPKLERIAEKNNITMLNFVPGDQEPELFKQKQYVAMHRSTLRKVDIIADVAERAYRRTLKTNANWWVQRGGTFGYFVDWVTGNTKVGFAIGIAGLLVAILGIIFCLHH